MRVPLSWLREFVALPDDTEAIAQRLAMLGFPVASIEKRPKIGGVVTGKIATLEKHPNADRLQVACVDVAGSAPLTIATAASNVAAGQTIAVAVVGARLPELTIEVRTMRGVASQGMMISAEELALVSEWFEDGIMQLDGSVAPGLDVVELFGLNTDVLDVEITANRPDSMSVVGLARELAASYGVPLRLPPFVNPGDESDAAEAKLDVSIESPDCHRFVAQYFDRVRVGPAPAWMRVRLALAGQRPINNLVDVSNYVMLETGQPLHFYDAREIANMRLIVRAAHDGERLVTLDGAERKLSTRALVIADDERALGLGGLMGGAASEVTPMTTAIVLEAANFNGARVRRMSAELGLRTEASSRHEKSLAPALTDVGAARAAQLLHDFGAVAYRPKTFGVDTRSQQPISLPVGDVERLLGIAIPARRIAAHLSALGFDVVPHTDETLVVTPPAWRHDVSLSADLVEEVARIEGYDRIPAMVPSVPSHEISSTAYDRQNSIANALAGLGYREVVTHSLHGASTHERQRAAGIAYDAVPVEVRNPLSEEQRFLRGALEPGLMECLAAASAPARVFEIGQIFRLDDGNVVEQTVAAFGFSADRNAETAWRDSSFLRLKGDCEALLRGVTGRHADLSTGAHSGFHPGKTAFIELGGARVGRIGGIDPRLSKAYGLPHGAYVCVLDVGALPPYAIPQYRTPSKFPSTYRDLALVVDAGIAARDLEDAIAATLGAICTGVRVFDEYRGSPVSEGRKSLAVRVTLQRFDATITDEEADAAIARVLEAVREKLGATLRT
ncbi:MAG: phenylalanine--tRNA ligase subunit beta [Candidatus Eremiobacteraeota bacterium]|nr:phenylalanine--tRNA ligase subunit beta [Candidatus Eremiobacteraeota bacterium]